MELCAWNLYNFINQFHPSKVNNKKKSLIWDDHYVLNFLEMIKNILFHLIFKTRLWDKY